MCLTKLKVVAVETIITNSMFKIRDLFLLIIFLSCNNSGIILQQEDQHIFPEMKNMKYMKNVHT